MAVIAQDDFNRANTTGPDLGPNWTNMGGGSFSTNGYQIVSSHAEPTTLTSDKMELYTGPGSFPNDQYAEAACTVTGTLAGSGPGVVVRGGDLPSNGSGYRLCVCKAASNNIELIRINAGSTFTSLALRTTTWIDGDVLRLEVQGSTLRIFQNAVQLGAAVDDGSPLTSGLPGIAYSTTATVAAVDDWEGGSLAAEVTATGYPHRGVAMVG